MSAANTANSPGSKWRWIHQHRLNSLAIVLGLILIMIGGSELVERYFATHGPTNLPSPTPQAIVDTPAAPDEKPPSSKQVLEYRVAADQPRSLRIRSVGISGLIQPVGTTKTNAMAVPTNIFFGGFYTGAAKPGLPGLSIINGHTTGRYRNGIFQRLGTAKIGDIIEVEFGDRSIKKFAVVSTKQLPEAESAAYLFSHRPGIASPLNLITCGGNFDQASARFADRVIVVAKLVNT
jgi:hypothetical protein